MVPAWALLVTAGVCFALGAIFTLVVLWVVQGGLAGGSD
jgi:hypothetical protein